MSDLIFFADEDVSGEAIRWARADGVLFVTIVEAGMRTSNDDRIPFDYAVQRGYVMVTANGRDYEPLFGEYLAAGIDVPGLMVITPGVRDQHRYIAQELRTYYFGANGPEDFVNRII